MVLPCFTNLNLQKIRWLQRNRSSKLAIFVHRPEEVDPHPGH